jgi:hypothetical protein
MAEKEKNKQWDPNVSSDKIGCVPFRQEENLEAVEEANDGEKEDTKPRA